MAYMRARYEDLIIAVGAFIDAVHPNFNGDIIAAMKAMADVAAGLDDDDPTIMDLCEALDTVK